MAKFIGRLSEVGAAKEVVRGTPVAPLYGLKWLELTLEAMTEATRNEQAFGNIAIGDDSTIIKRWGEISMTSKIHDISLGLLLLSTFGQVNSVEKIAPNTGVYDHTFTVANNNQHPSLTIAHKSPNEDERFPLAMMDSFKINLDPENYPTIEMAMMSKEPESASNTITYSVERDFLSKQMEFKYANDVSGLNAATPINRIRSGSIEIKKNVLLEYVMGSVTPVDILNQGLEVTGSLTLVHDDTAFEQIQNQELSKAFRFDFIHTDTIGTSANPQFRLDMNKVKIMNYEVSRSPNELAEESFDFEAFYSIAEASQIYALLTNTVASY